MSNEKTPVTYGSRIVWLDVETTSLRWDDRWTKLLEVGICVTDLELREVVRESVVIRHSEHELVVEAEWDPIAEGMHWSKLGGSGLAEECVSSLTALSMEEAEQVLLLVLARDTEVDLTRAPNRPGCGSGYPNAPLWGGCSPLLDRMMIKRCMPRLYERIHYRTLDASTLREAMRLWIGKDTTRATDPHRGLADAVSASKLANTFRRMLIQSNKALVATTT